MPIDHLSLSTTPVNLLKGTLRRILDNPEAMAAVERIEGWRALGDNIIETISSGSTGLDRKSACVKC